MHAHPLLDVQKKPEPAPEPEIVIDWMPLDTSRASPVWLIKVPRVMADLWEKAAEGQELGRLNIDTDSSDPTGAKVKLTAEMNPFGSELPTDWEIPFRIPSHLNVFTEDVAGRVSMEGVVQYQMELTAKDANKLRKAQHEEVHRAHQPQTKPTKLHDTSDDVKRHGAALFHLSGREQKSGKIEKRERMDKDQLVELLLQCFQQKDCWNVVELNKIVDQPVNHLKTVLGTICDYNKTGPNRLTYQLKPEYAAFRDAEKQQKEGGSAPAQEDAQ
eukprot:TRINITY_DN1632_c0_g1_i1.p1 TRINITY_DN1632_c0_g1~~TRINITY_DN1632_c0_g1_i1.p1  ORF type:complete len:279 (-),score=62.62 TRINITY_DN1632_c0_g1_i1:122-937(-)